MMNTAKHFLACDDQLPSITKIGTNRFPCVGLILVQLQSQFRSLGRSSRASRAADWSGGIKFTDPNAVNFPQRFYRFRMQ